LRNSARSRSASQFFQIALKGCLVLAVVLSRRLSLGMRREMRERSVCKHARALEMGALRAHDEEGASGSLRWADILP